MLFAFSACNKNDSKASLNLSSSSSSFSTSASTTNLLWYESALPMDFVYKERHYMILTEFGTKTIVDKDEIGDLLGYLIREDDVEAYSSGLKKVYKECKEANIKIEYIKHQHGFSFVFCRSNGINQINDDKNKAELSSDEIKILNILKQNQKISINDLSLLIGRSTRTIQRTLNSLKRKGYLLRVGNTKGYWSVINY